MTFPVFFRPLFRPSFRVPRVLVDNVERVVGGRGAASASSFVRFGGRCVGIWPVAMEFQGGWAEEYFRAARGFLLSFVPF